MLAADPDVEEAKKQGAPEGNQNANKNKGYNINFVSDKPKGGTGQEYLVKRLKRDAPDIAEAFARGEYPSAMLSDKEWSSWSDREIARHCGVSQWLVTTVRASDSSFRYNNKNENNSLQEKNTKKRIVARNGTVFMGKQRKRLATVASREPKPSIA